MHGTTVKNALFWSNTLQDIVFKYLVDNPVIFFVIYISVEQFSFKHFSFTDRPFKHY